MVLSSQAGLTQISPASNGYFMAAADDIDMTADAWSSIWIGSSGDLEIELAGSPGTALLLKNVPNGTLLPLRIIVISSASTTATDFVLFK